MLKLKILLIIVLSLFFSSSPIMAQTTKKSSAGDCIVGNLGNWFADKSVVLNGAVDPANSVTFSGQDDCDFIKWGSQMFLWLTSPSNAGQNYVFNDAGFYQAIPQGNGNFTVALDPNTAKNLSLRAAKKSTAQAGGGDVLISQNGSVVYYGIHINNIYVAYKWGPNRRYYSAKLKNNFPTTQADLTQIETIPIAQNRSIHFPVKNDIALAMEIKTSWVEASTLPNVKDYVTITAEIPEYTKTAKKWTATGKMKNTLLALVGMHVVGSANGHPELIWATFEHVNNAPDAAYYYGKGASPTLVPFNSASSIPWTFYGSATTPPAKITPNAQSTWNGTSKQYDIACSSNCPIAAVDVFRRNPWGSAPNSKAVAGLNADFVSLNASVQKQLSAHDIRGNYIQTGSIWSSDGSIPTSGTDTDLAGSLLSANTTMETFHQFPDKNNNFVSNNCFTCHSVSAGGAGTGVSHIFSGLKLP